MVKHSKKIYKTIRHGENSLQYTILPQNDDFRLEGRIKSVASGKRSGVASNTAVRPRSRARRSFFAYLGVLFICTILVGAVLIPFLVSTECLPNPTEWFLRTKAALMHRGLELAFVGRNNASISAINPSNINQTMMESSTVSTAVTEAATIITMATTVTSDPSNPTEGLRSLSASRDEKDKLVLQLNRLNATTTTTIAPPNQLIDMNSIGSTHASGKSAVKESSIPASIASVAMTTSPVDKNAIEHQRNMAWIQGHWPYIDPSTYFQWNVCLKLFIRKILSASCYLKITVDL